MNSFRFREEIQCTTNTAEFKPETEDCHERCKALAIDGHFKLKFQFFLYMYCVS